MLALWSLMHGSAMLIIRGRFEGPLRSQAVHACVDAFDVIVNSAAHSKGLPNSGPKWPTNLILGEAAESRVENEKVGTSRKSRNRKGAR